MQVTLPATTIAKDLEYIALEAGVLSNMISTVRNMFPDLLNKLSTGFNACNDLPQVKPEFSKEQKFVLAEMHVKQFLDIADVKIDTPENFKGKYLDYISCLIKEAKHTQHLSADVLKPFVVYLSQFVSNKEAKLSTKDMTRTYSTLEKTRLESIKELDRFVSESHKTTTTIGDVISRRADFNTLFNETFVLNKIINDTDLKIVKDNVKTCVDLMNTIVKQSQDNTLTTISPEVTKNIAYGATELAKQVEFLAVLHFRAHSFSTAVNSMATNIGIYIRGEV